MYVETDVLNITNKKKSFINAMSMNIWCRRRRRRLIDMTAFMLIAFQIK